MTQSELPMETFVPEMGGSPLKDLSQMYPHPSKSSQSGVQKEKRAEPVIEEDDGEETDLDNFWLSSTPKTQDLLRLKELKENLVRQIAEIDEKLQASLSDDEELSPPKQITDSLAQFNLVIPSTPEIFSEPEVLQERSSCANIKLTGSHLSVEEWRTVEIAAARLGASCSKKYSSQITHVIVKTSKLLLIIRRWTL